MSTRKKEQHYSPLLYITIAGGLVYTILILNHLEAVEAFIKERFSRVDIDVDVGSMSLRMETEWTYRRRCR